MEVNTLILNFIKALNQIKPKVKFELIANTMYRLPPTQYAKAGEIAVDIQIKCGVKKVNRTITYSLAEEIMLNPFGKSMAEDYVHELVKKIHNVL